MSLFLDDTFGKVFIISQAFQCSLIIIIIIITVLFNCSIIINISNCDIKSRIVSFVLIKNLCIVDLVGTLLILPVPLAATIQGEFEIENSKMLKRFCIVLMSKIIRIIPRIVYFKFSIFSPPSVVLCIPLLPGGFFIAVFSVFCVLLTIIMFGFLIAITYLKKVSLYIDIL